MSGLGNKEAARTSVLSRRWKDLWKFSRTLCFDKWDTSVRGRSMTKERFKAWVNYVLLHHASHVDSFRLSCSYFDLKKSDVDTWICQTLRYKQPKHFDIYIGLDQYKFPFPLLLNKINTCAFASVISLKLAGVFIEDAMFHCFLASCVNLECLSICRARYVKNLQFVDPLPKLKILEICNCFELKSLEISIATLVSCTLKGLYVDVPFKNVPKNLSEVTFGDSFCFTFFRKADKHTVYSPQLERLNLDLSCLMPYGFHGVLESPNLPLCSSLKILDVETISLVERSLLFFTMLIKACPVLHEFRIKINYDFDLEDDDDEIKPLIFSLVNKESTPIFHHANLKLVEFRGYIGCSTEHEFLSRFAKIAPSLKALLIDTWVREFEPPIHTCRVKTAGEFAGSFAKSRSEAREHAQQLCPKFPLETQLIII